MSSSQTFWILVQTTFTYTSLFLPTTFTYMKQWIVAILFGLGEDVWNPDSGLGENRLAEWKSYQKWHRKLSWLWLPPWCSFIIILKLIEQTHKSGHCRQIPSSTRGLSEYDAKFIFQTINCALLCTAMEQCTKYLSLARPRLRSIKTALRNSAIGRVWIVFSSDRSSYTESVPWSERFFRWQCCFSIQVDQHQNLTSAFQEVFEIFTRSSATLHASK